MGKRSHVIAVLIYHLLLVGYTCCVPMQYFLFGFFLASVPLSAKTVGNGMIAHTSA